MAGEWALLKPNFEHVSGHRLEIFFGTTPNLIKEATSGKPFDLAVVPSEFMRDAGARRQSHGGPDHRYRPHRPWRRGARRRGEAEHRHGRRVQGCADGAQSIATVSASAAGAQVMRAIERVGLAERSRESFKRKPRRARSSRRSRRAKPSSAFPHQRADRAGSRCCRALPARAAAGNRVHGGAHARDKGSRGCESADRLPQVAGSDRDHQGEGHDAKLRRGAGIFGMTKVALITGAARGIGLATAKRFLAEG